MDNVPSNWKKTLDEDDDVRSWIGHRDFPNTVQEMIPFISSKFYSSSLRMIEHENQIPQSFANWWCYVRAERIRRRQSGDMTEENIPPNYPRINRWKHIIREQHSELLNNPDMVSDMDVITVFMTWLDQLYTDIILFQSDERGRSTIPRLHNSRIVKGGNATSRRETMSFIKKQGHGIFYERGFLEGQTFWKQICKKYNI